MKGYLDARLVKAVVFWVITGCLVITVACSILMVWDADESESLRRGIMSAGVLACGALLFQALNLAFGTIEAQREQTNLYQASQVGDALRRAKDSARGGPDHAE